MHILVYFAFVTIFAFLTSCTLKPANIQSRFGFDQDGMVIVNGERKFIIGTYSLPNTDVPFKRLAENGYNYVKIKPELANLDSAQKNNIYTWMAIGTAKDNVPDSGKNKIIGRIKEFKNHPSLLCWEIIDEPAFVWKSAEAKVMPQVMLETYKLIKTFDSEHFVITNHGPVNLISTLEKYNNSCDIVSCDIYPVIPRGIDIIYGLYPDGLQGDLLNTYLSQVGEYVDKMKKVVHYAKPIFMVLQGFAWEMLKKENERDTAMVLYPTYKESRFMAYDAIIHGANGIVYWGLNRTPPTHPFMDSLNLVTKELSEMQAILAAPALDYPINVMYHELGYSVDRGIEMLVKKVKNSLYIITVNADRNPVKITFSGFEQFRNATVLKENRKFPIQRGEFSDSYLPFGVHIYLVN